MDAAGGAGGSRRDGGKGKGKGKGNGNGSGNDFTDILFSWSLNDIYQEDFYSKKVKKIPDTFGSEEHYQQSFIYPLLEETRADLHSSLESISSAPCAAVTGFHYSKIDHHGMILYDVAVDQWRNRFNDRRKEPYKTLPGDVLLLVDAKPHSVIDLKRVGRTWAFAVVADIPDDAAYFRVKMPWDFELKDDMQLYAVFLISITPSRRIWNALHMSENWGIIRKVLDMDSKNEAECNLSSMQDGCLLPGPVFCSSHEYWRSSSDLNGSQLKAISACLQKIQCEHRSAVELIWGPPGTGKTKTTSTMLYLLFKMKCRSLVCAPTNVAIKEVASRVLRLLRDDSSAPHGGSSKVYYSLGDILLFGSRDRLKVDIDAEEIFLDYRVERIAECLAPLTGWRHCFTCMIDFLGDSIVQYRIFSENERTERSDHESTKEKTFLEFMRERFRTILEPLQSCLYTLCTHIPKSFIGESLFHDIIELVTELKLFETSLHGKHLLNLTVEAAFPCSEVKPPPKKSLRGSLLKLYQKRCKCLDALKSIFDSLCKLDLPSFRSRDSIIDYCFQQASLIFCTASNTYKLHSVDMVPPSLLVIDEAAQLRECESMIPLQLPGLKHVILVGDECQLPSMVKSHRAEIAGFGRSLFGRLSSLGAPKHLLNMQYRMHPSISCFPNDKFYDGQIDDASNVTDPNYRKTYLSWPMFGPYSFINIANGREQKGKGKKSFRNSVEVALVLEILNNLYKAWNASSKEKLSIGVISPYSAQVGAIREKLGPKYENLGDFTVKVMTVDGFQGGEEDIIIISTVRSNHGGSIGFLSSPQRTNVALTRARYALWILGSEKTLTARPSEWTALVKDAKDRKCFFNAEDEENLANVILEVKKEDDQLEDLLYDRSLLFKDSKWKVIFPKSFCQSFEKLRRGTKSSVVDHVKKLLNGWRPAEKIKSIDCPKSTQIVKTLEVEGLHIMWTIDIQDERSYFQLLKFWYIVPREHIDRKVKHLDSMYEKYGVEFINRCKEKYLDGDLEVPKTWEHPSDYVEQTNSSKNNEKDAIDYADKKKQAKAFYELKIYDKASTLFQSVGEFERAAECFYMLQQYEGAAKIYLEKCGESALARAAECFSLAGCHEMAVETYAKCNMFSECLSSCAKGELFDLGMHYIQTWRQKEVGFTDSAEIKGPIQDFLKTCARHFHNQGDSAAMMSFVRAFQSLDMMINFLRSLDCLYELLCLEEKMGIFPEAANVAKMKGDLIIEAYLFGKGGYFKDAALSLVRNMLFRSLWESGSKGWPLKQFHGKEELVAKAISYALLVQEPFYEKVRIESAIILGNDIISSMEMQDLLSASQKAGSVMGEILCSWRVLDGYLSMDSSKICCKISENQISLGNLMSVWNIWKDKIIRVIQSVEFLGTDCVDEHGCYVEFCLNYLGAFRNCAAANEKEIILLNPLAEWVTSVQDRFLERQGSWVAVEVLDFVSAAQKFWCSEMISVGLQMLHCLNSVNNSMASIHVYEVAKFLVDSQLLNCTENDKSLLLKFIADSSMNCFRHMFPLDWRKSPREDLISLCETETYLCLLKERIRYIESKKSVSYGQLGHLAMIILGSRKFSGNNVSQCCKMSQPWKSLIDWLHKNEIQDIDEVWLIPKLHGALHDTYTADWRQETDYISPNCFLYLIERLLILSSCRKAQFFATKSGFAEWFTYNDGDYTNLKRSSTADFEESADVAFRFVSFIVFELLENKRETRKWILKSNMYFEEYYPLMVLKLVVLACLLHINYRKCSDLLFDLLSKKEISEKLPHEFYLTLWNTRKQHKRLNINANVLAEAFAIINDPIVVVTVGQNVSTLLCKDAIFVDLTSKRSKEEILRNILRETAEVSKNGYGEGKSRRFKICIKRSLPSAVEDLNENTKNEMVMELWKVVDTLERAFDGEDGVQLLSFVSSMRADLDHLICLFYQSLNQYIWDGKGKLLLLDRDGTLDAARMNFSGTIDDLKQMSTALLDMMRERKLEQSMIIKESLERLQSRRAVLEPLLHQMFQQGCCSSTPVHPPTSNGNNNIGSKKWRKKQERIKHKVNSSTEPML